MFAHRLALSPDSDEKTSLKGGKSNEKELALLIEIYEAISLGAEAFLRAEYSVCAVFIAIFAVVIFALISWSQDTTMGALTTISFILGALTSVASGYIGMRVAVYSNVRTTINAQKEGYMHCFNTAFRAGSVMGFALSGMGVFMLYVTMLAFLPMFTDDTWVLMMGCISGYGLGGR